MTIRTLKELIATKEMKEALEEILNLSRLAPAQKAFLKAVIIDRLSQRKALQKAFGRDLGYEQELISRALFSDPAVKEVIAAIRQIYLQVVPIAILKEIDIMLDPKNDPEIQLRAAQDIQNRAGLTEQGGGRGSLPVTVIINAPPGTKQTLTQVNVNKDGE